MKTIMLELRDKATFIPIMCTEVSSGSSDFHQENWLLKRAGFGERCIQLTSFMRKQSNYDPYEWGDRTYAVAHEYITKNWDDIEHGDVIDVEFILGESEKKKISEREEF